MTARTPVDQDARDQVRTDHSHTLFVEAAAGTGKTQALVDRAVSLVARGAPLRSIAAITFTEAAAAELRDRIRDALEEAAAGTDPYVTAPEEQTRCRAALADLDDAALTTLHGFAQRILADHPLEAGLPPGFEVLDEVAAGVRFEQRWSEFVQLLLDDEALSDLVLQGFALGLAPDVLRQVARTLRDNYDRVDRPTPARETLPPLDLRPFLEAVDVALGMAAECRDPDDKLFQHLQLVAVFRTELDAAADDLDRLDFLRNWSKLKSSLGRAANWSSVNDVRDRLRGAQDAFDELLAGRRRLVVGVLLDRVVDWAHEQAAERARAGEVEFHDLLVL
ncbi:MAG: UvrD-helicase domain-containing protein, partial [Acidimicrobiia bacterium]